MASALSAAALAPSLRLDPSAPPPLQAVLSRAAAAPEAPLLITNHGVGLLRAAAPALRVYDAHYAGGAAMAALLHEGPVWRISSAPPPESAGALRLPGRWPGERTMYLMALEPPHAE